LYCPNWSMLFAILDNSLASYCFTRVATLLLHLKFFYFKANLTKDIVLKVNIHYISILTHGAKPFLRSRQLCSYSRTSSILCNPKVHFRVHKSPPPVPTLSQINPNHTISSYLSIVHPPTSCSSLWSLSFWLSHQYLICIRLLPPSCYMSCPSHPPCLDHSNYTWRRQKFWSSSLCNFLQPPVTSSLVGPNIR
jgi:hypothetical protein